MKKIVSQISLILIIMTVAVILFFITEVSAASKAGISCPTSVNEGEDFTVTLTLPGEAYAAEADIVVKFSDNSTSSGRIVYVKGMSDFPNTISFKANVAGNTQISVKNILISDINNSPIEQGGTTSATLNVVGKSSGDNNQGGGNNSSNSGNTTPTTPSTPSTPSTPTTPTTPSTPSTSDKPTTSTTPKFTDVNETVYTTTKCNLRESYSSDSKKIDTVAEGTKLTRKGVGDNGWSKCDYNGKTVYVSSQYLTTTAPKDNSEDKDKKEPEEVKFKDTKENLYASKSCNVRSSWSTDSERVGYLNKGQEVERTGYADNGWSRILYEGKTAYVLSSLLSVDKPEDDKKPEENTVANEVVKEDTEINEDIEYKLSEEEMLNIIKEEVGVLPEVGTNLANIAYIIVTTIVLSGIICALIYIKKIK